MKKMKKIISLVVVCMFAMCIMAPALAATTTQTAKLGDVNGDQQITAEDANLLLKYVMKSQTANLSLGVADVNSDKKITSEDATILVSFVNKKITKLPHTHKYDKNAMCACGTKKAPTKLGDVNSDKKVTAKDAMLLLNYVMAPSSYTIAVENADFDKNGVINSNDAIAIYNKCLGDANGDGKINSSDATLLLRHSSNPTKYPIVEENCDLNSNDMFDSNDAIILQAFVDKKITQLPHVTHTYVNNKCACGDEILLGDVNGDKKITSEDSILLLKHVNNPTRFPIIEKNGDVDQNGVIDSKDAEAVKKLIK